jgi:hypothetical protein
MTKRSAAADFAIREGLQRRRDQAAVEVDCLQSEIDDARNLIRRLDLERRRDRLVNPINTLEAMISST